MAREFCFGPAACVPAATVTVCGKALRGPPRPSLTMSKLQSTGGCDRHAILMHVELRFSLAVQLIQRVVTLQLTIYAGNRRGALHTVSMAARMPHLRQGQSRDIACMQSYAVGSYCSSSSSPTSSTPAKAGPPCTPELPNNGCAMGDAKWLAEAVTSSIHLEGLSVRVSRALEPSEMAQVFSLITVLGAE